MTRTPKGAPIDGAGPAHRPRRVPVLLAVALLLASAGGVAVGLAVSGLLAPRPEPEMTCADADDAQDPDLPPLPMTYESVRLIEIGLADIRAIAIDADDRLYVAGDDGITVFSRDGVRLRSWTTSARPRCVAVGASGTVYAALEQRVETFTADGAPLKAWGKTGDEPGGLRYVTAIAAAEPYVYVADFGNRCVHRFTRDGDFVQDIPAGDEGEPGTDRLTLPSPYLDCAADTAGRLYLNHTGLRKVETYSPRGRLLRSWGRSGGGRDAFPGCCNPTHLAVLPDGSVVTGQKGDPVVKRFDRDGSLLAVMGVGLFAAKNRGLDLAVDSEGAIFATDPAAGGVRVFKRQQGDP